MKRKCDAAIAHGTDIKDARAVFDVPATSESTVLVWYIEDKSVSSVSSELENVNVVTVQGTMKIHQLYCHKRNTIKHPVLSCFCNHPDPCSCMSLSNAVTLAVFKLNEPVDVVRIHLQGI